MMSNDHVVELPKAVWAIKIVQSIIAVLVLAFSAFTVAVLPNGYSGFCIFTALFSGITLIYYFVSIRANKSLYNWIALLVLECFNVLWWLVVWALVAALAAAASVSGTYVTTYDDYYDDYYYKRDLTKRVDYGTLSAALYLVYVVLAFGVINWILFCVTLGFLSKGIHLHRKAGKPMVAGGSSSAGWNNASREEKHDMQPMPAAQTYQQQPIQANDYPQQQQGTYPPSPVPANTHEAYGGNRYP